MQVVKSVVTKLNVLLEAEKYWLLPRLMKSNQVFKRELNFKVAKTLKQQFKTFMIPMFNKNSLVPFFKFLLQIQKCFQDFCESNAGAGYGKN